MAFPPQFLDELRNRLSIAEVIQRRVRLQKRGREFMGLCPFHNEKTPSFTVSEEKGFFHCFGCGAHGDVVGFVMRAEGLSFPEAVERLADQAGLQVPKATPEERQRAERQATLLGVMEAAAVWFEQQLAGAGGRQAGAYLDSRGLAEATIARFRLGWAPDSRNALRSALLEQGFPEALALEAGLVIRPESGGDSYDRFRGRVMFPIADRRGRVIAFGGRILDDGQPKYLNSPETPLFHKGRVLYGLAQALKAARDAGEVVVAEGYMDVIALAQAGITQAVAPLGTALTEEQMAELWRLAPEPILCFDGDAAGQRAAARAADRALALLKPGHSFRFALLPAGEDPDSLVRHGGAAAIRDILDAARPLADLLWEAETLGRSLDTPERRSGLRESIRERIGRIADRLVAEDYRLEMARPQAPAVGGGPAGGPRGAKQPINKSAQGRRGFPPAAATLGGEAARRGVPGPERQQLTLVLATVINHPALLYRHAEELAEMPALAGDLDGLRRVLVDLAAGHLDLDSEAVRDHLSQQGFSGMLSALLGGTRTIGFVDPRASLEQAEEGLAHVFGLMRESEAKRETAVAAQRLAEELTPEALARFEARQRVVQHGESRRRDFDRDGPLAARTKR